MSTNTGQQNTGAQTQSDKEILNTARDKMDYIRGNSIWCWFANGNKKRKKLKRWFDRCKKKKIEDNNTKEGECCYKIDKRTNAIYMGKKGSTNDNQGFQLPYIGIGIDNYEYDIYCQKEKGSQQAEKKNLMQMSYDNFYKLYRKAVGYCGFRESFLDVYDGFMSWTQVPRQIKSGNGAKAKSVGSHVANIATRVFSPVIAPVIATATGAFFGAAAACVGAKALKDKIITTDDELLQRTKRIRDSYKFTPQIPGANKNSELEKAKENYNIDVKSFNEWVDKVFRYYGQQAPDIVEQRINWYQDNIIEHDLKEIHKAQTQQTTQGQ